MMMFVLCVFSFSVVDRLVNLVLIMIMFVCLWFFSVGCRLFGCFIYLLRLWNFMGFVLLCVVLLKVFIYIIFGLLDVVFFMG